MHKRFFFSQNANAVPIKQVDELAGVPAIVGYSLPSDCHEFVHVLWTGLGYCVWCEVELWTSISLHIPAMCKQKAWCPASLQFVLYLNTHSSALEVCQRISGQLLYRRAVHCVLNVYIPFILNVYQCDEFDVERVLWLYNFLLFTKISCL